MTTKLVSINTIDGDDLTPAPTCYPGQTISQSQAILAICRRADPQILPVVKRRQMAATKESYRPRFTWSTRWIRAILIVVTATAVSCGLIAMNW